MKLTEQEKEYLLNRVRAIAESKGGQCLSESYKNAVSHLEFKCSNPEHEPWKASYSNVVHYGSWCPHCNHDHKKQMNMAHQVAQEHGGECLSTEYKGSNGKLLWKCSNPKHSPWESRFSSVVNLNSWCPHCYEEQGRRKPKPRKKGT